MTKLILDLSDPEIAEACGDCKPGEPLSFSNVSGTVTAVSGKAITLDVSDIEYSGGDKEAAPEDTAEGEPTPGRKTPPAVSGLMEG